MKLRDWIIALAGMALLGLAYADRQRADAESACRDVAVIASRGGP